MSFEPGQILCTMVAQSSQSFTPSLSSHVGLQYVLMASESVPIGHYITAGSTAWLAAPCHRHLLVGGRWALALTTLESLNVDRHIAWVCRKSHA